MKNIGNYIQEKLHISKDLVKPRIYSVFVKTGIGKYVPEIFDTPQEALQFIIDNNVSIKAIYGFRKKEDAEKLTDITYKVVRSQIDKKTAEKMKKELDFVMIKGDDVEQIIAGKANIEDFLTEKLHLNKSYKSESLLEQIIGVFDFNDYENAKTAVAEWIKNENVKDVEYIIDFEHYEFLIPTAYHRYIKYDTEEAKKLEKILIYDSKSKTHSVAVTQEEDLYWIDGHGLLNKSITDEDGYIKNIYVKKV